MQNKVVGKMMSIIQKKHKLDPIKYEQIEYGLAAIYIMVTKLLFISIVSFLLGIFKETIVFLLLFNGIRLFAFGLHATKSYICLIASTIAFIGLPYLTLNLELNIYFKIILGTVMTLLILKNSPADTYKRPIVSQKRRIFFKATSTIIAVTYVILSLYTSNFVSNSLLFSLLLENIFISPLTYKIFKLPYNNYLTYMENMRKEDLHVS